MGKKKIKYLINYWTGENMSLPKEIDYNEYKKLKNKYIHYIETKEVKNNKTLIKALEIIEECVTDHSK